GLSGPWGRTPWTPGTGCGLLGRRGLTGGVHSVHGVQKNAQYPASQEAALAAGYSQSPTDYVDYSPDIQNGLQRQ
ncbi:MAG TPA: hypothetical protein PLE35_11740, partial [Lentisphaeria bacterium]|nr:hypothetical protein [Lentisphaeria bacterium]